MALVRIWPLAGGTYGGTFEGDLCSGLFRFTHMLSLKYICEHRSSPKKYEQKHIFEH